MLSCKSYCQTINNGVSPTGRQLREASIKLNDIRLIDSLLIEYKYLKKEVIYKDSIIFEYDKMVDTLKVSNDNLIAENNKLIKDNTKKKDKIKKLTLASIGTSIVTILAIIFR